MAGFPHFPLLPPSYTPNLRQFTKIMANLKAFCIDEIVISGGNWKNEYIYCNSSGFVPARMKAPSEESEAAGREKYA